jgi:hypothetical protein
LAADGCVQMSPHDPSNEAAESADERIGAGRQVCWHPFAKKKHVNIAVSQQNTGSWQP